LEKLDETRRYVSLANEAHKEHIKVEYEKSIHPWISFEGDLVLVDDQANDNLG
jgi:hypothetical protein